MAGKAYTMREMRAIVEYLAERKAYSEIKGRKMWMEYANSEKTVRTWQSLKETFLKRILPDIQNPYYKLTMDQVRSFKQGYDVAEKEKNNRLEFRTASEESNGDSQDDNEKTTTKTDDAQPTTSNDHESTSKIIDKEPPSESIDEELGKATGEGITSAKIVSRCRSSADTVVLEYENADELQRVLESPKNDENEQTKSLKDLLTFEHTAPLTPLVRELLNDFETESEASDKEPRLNIDENRMEITENTESEPILIEDTTLENNNIINNVESIIEIHDTEDLNNVEVSNIVEVQTTMPEETTLIDGQEKENDSKKNDELKIKRRQNNDEEEIASTQEPVVDTELPDATNAEVNNTTKLPTADCNAETAKDNVKKHSINSTAIIENSLQNTGNTSSDTILPNNQEALNDNAKNVTQNMNQDKKSDLKQVSVTNDHGKTDDLEKVNCETKEVGKKITSEEDESKQKKLPYDKSSETKEGEVSASINEITDTPSNHNSVSILEKGTKRQTKNVCKKIDSPESTKKQLDDLQNTVCEDTQDPCKSAEDASLSMNKERAIERVEEKNPCLLSVSLFDEQFKNTKYSDSDSDDEATPLPKPTLNKNGPQIEKMITEDKPQTEAVTKKATAEKIVKQIEKKETVLETSIEQQRKGMINKKNVDNKAVSLNREKALANMFGFAHGVGAPSSRKRQLSHRRSHHKRRRHSNHNDSNSSEWTSQSDSESYVSPPRGRRNRHTRKYLRPKSSRILQDPEEGMLYVIFGKNIYPVVKDGTHIKNFLTYRPDSGSDMEEESYWRQKYVEEKKRVEEVKKLLKESQNSKPVNVRATTSPILPSPAPSRNTSTYFQRKPAQNDVDVKRDSKESNTTPKDENKTESVESKLVLKIAGKDGLEYCLEGGWTQISNAMPQMVRMLQSETTVPSKEKLNRPSNSAGEKQPSGMENNNGKPVEVSSGASTPINQLINDPEVHKKVDTLEKEIFQEIEELDKEQKLKQNDPERGNVTKRKPGRPRKESSSPSLAISNSPSKKRARISKTTLTESKPDSKRTSRSKRVSKPLLDVPTEIETKQVDIEKPTTSTRAKPKIIVTQNEETNQQTEVPEQKELDPKAETSGNQLVIDPKPSDQRKSSRLSKQTETTERSGSLASSEVSPARKRSFARLVRTPIKYVDTDSSASDVRVKKSTSKETTEFLGFDEEDARFMFPPSKINKKKATKGRKRSLPQIIILPPQDNASGNTIDSTCGYQDSDGSLLFFPKKKKKLSLTTQKKYIRKNRRLLRRNSNPTLLQDFLSDSNNSSYFVPVRKSQSTLNSEVYRTESFQLLLPKEKHLINKLDRIDEINTNQFDSNVRHFNSVSRDSDKSRHDNSNIVVEVASSSGVSLPLSPELSVVEKLSISRDMIKCDNYPTINETQTNMNNHAMDYSEYSIPNLDVSVPLMDQQCVLQSTDKLLPKKKTAKNLSNSFVAKECSVRIEDLTLSETLDQRLRNLLLESNKKAVKSKTVNGNAMEVDKTNVKKTKKKARAQKATPMDVDEPKVSATKKTKAKKRSSTPRKKKTSQKANVPKDPVIEEHMESCSYVSRKSCPPVISHHPVIIEQNTTDGPTTNAKVKTKKTKDVFKVKIQRPNTQSKAKLRKSLENVSVISTYTDSGINETATTAFLKESEDSVDLIHNHSETCLLANECVGDDSVQFIENSNSVISLSSSEQSVLNELQKILDDAASLSGELFNESQDQLTTEPKTSEKYESPKTASHTPAATNSSLITEDLSDEPNISPTKWYLVSEDDNTQFAPSAMTSCGANLNQIFPVTYAVPNLSTISEMSKENGDSRKASLDTAGDTRKSILKF